MRRSLAGNKSFFLTLMNDVTGAQDEDDTQPGAPGVNTGFSFSAEQAMNVSVTIYVISCKSYNELADQWSTDGCTVLNASADWTTCSCTHMTLFGASSVAVSANVNFEPLTV